MGNKFFGEVKKNFGFGLMRLPMMDKKVDIEQTKQMVDIFIENGFNYFDTAHGYIDGMSETAFRECVAERYDRNQYTITNKLTEPYFQKEEDIIPFFESQLEACGVDYFDFYLMHAQDSDNYPKFKKCRAYETGLKLKEMGKIKHFGLSFHDTPEVLDQILTDYPQVEVVQIQLNYLDYENPSVQGKGCYDVCVKHGKPCIIMEPVKGGHLANIPDSAAKVFDELQKDEKQKNSYASYAVRYTASFPNVFMVISGMSTLEQMEDNISYMKDFKPIDEKEKDAIDEVIKIYGSINMVPCTACRYCVTDSECPMKIQIPEIFSCYNQRVMYNDWNQQMYYGVITRDHGKASECIKCGKCENICPQHLPIRNLLEDVAKEFEK